VAGQAMVAALAVTRETCMSNISVFVLSGSILIAALLVSWSHASAASGDNVGIAASGPNTLFILSRTGTVCKYVVQDTGGSLMMSRQGCN